VALFLAVASPLLRRARPVPRLLATLALIGWFVVLTRAEPSVLRAGMMASLAAVAFALGNEREPPRLLAIAVIVLLLVDPLLVESVGFWLSVGATAGVTIIGPPLRRRLSWLGWLASPLAMTLAAQAGVAAPSLLVFGRLSFAGTIANLVAIPVAGLVMLYGLPACIVAGIVEPLRAVVMFPVALGVRWVDGVAVLAARAEPAAPWSAVCWTLLALVIGAACCVRRGDDDHEDLLRQ
jgi:competence protein ComEC